MENHVLTYGPLSICVDASSWASYVSGTLTTCTDDVDHCVQAVGINQDEGYWTVSTVQLVGGSLWRKTMLSILWLLQHS